MLRVDLALEAIKAEVTLLNPVLGSLLKMVCCLLLVLTKLQPLILTL